MLKKLKVDYSYKIYALLFAMHVYIKENNDIIASLKKKKISYL